MKRTNRTAASPRLARTVTAALAATALLLTACGGESDSAGSPTVPSLAPASTEPATRSGTDGTPEAPTETAAGNDTDSTVEAPTDPEEAAALYQKCMEDRGISMEVDDPMGVGGGNPDFAEADEECQKHTVNVVQDLDVDAELMAEAEDQTIAYATCMQTAGFDVVAEGGGVLIPVGEPDRDGFVEADTECTAKTFAAGEGSGDGAQP